MSWWIWCIIGLGGVALELAAPTGFYLFLLGVAGIVTGAIVATGIIPDWPAQAILFSVLALANCALFAKPLTKFLRGERKAREDTVGQTVKIAASVAPGAMGSAELWGSPWRVRNVDSRELAAGSECVVVAVEGVTLHVTNKA